MLFHVGQGDFHGCGAHCYWLVAGIAYGTIELVGKAGKFLSGCWRIGTGRHEKGFPQFGMYVLYGQGQWLSREVIVFIKYFYCNGSWLHTLFVDGGGKVLVEVQGYYIVLPYARREDAEHAGHED